MGVLTASVRSNAVRLFRGADIGTLAAFTDLNHDRFPLWLPVLFGSGIALYFALPTEPSGSYGIAALMGAILAVLLLRRQRRRGYPFAVAAALIAAGFMAAQARTAMTAAPTLDHRIGPTEISGRIIHAEPTGRGARLLLDRLRIPGLDETSTPERVRVSTNIEDGRLVAGARIRLLAILQPPPEPSLPGGFDFARKAWFERIGGVGFSLGAVREVRPGASSSVALEVARIRQAITAKILAGAPRGVAPVAAALMTGERRAIPESILADMRNSGLAHLLAISGLHIGLVAGLLFFAVRLGLAGMESVALRYPIKKIAAVAALAGAFVYLIVSGATIPTQRAFLMVAIVLAAILFDRNAISMRLVAIAAGIVLLTAPESLLSASFQMSFAAVVGLVAVYEAASPRLASWRRDGGLPTAVFVFLGATLLTSVVATAATAPFALYHFNRMPLYGLAANMIAVPLTAIWIMPWAIVSFLLMPFGLESLGLVPMGWGLHAVLAVAHWIAALPGAVFLVPSMPLAALAAIAFGGLWIALWRGPVRFAGLALVAMGIGIATLASAPDVLVGPHGRLFAVNFGHGKVFLSPGKGQTFEREMWLRRLAAAEPAAWPGPGSAPDARFACDAAGCIAKLHGRTLALVRSPEAAVTDCRRVDAAILLTRMPRRLCRGADVLATTFHLWRDGAQAIFLPTDGPARIETVRESRGDRPWSRLAPRKRQYLRTRPTSRP